MSKNIAWRDIRIQKVWIYRLANIHTPEGILQDILQPQKQEDTGATKIHVRWNNMGAPKIWMLQKYGCSP